MNAMNVIVGDPVIVSAPSAGDIWNNEFTGTVVGIKTDTTSNDNVIIIVEDQDGECFDVDIEKVSKDF